MKTLYRLQKTASTKKEVNTFQFETYFGQISKNFRLIYGKNLDILIISSEMSMELFGFEAFCWKGASVNTVHVLAISPYTELGEQILKISSEFPYVNLVQFSGNLQEAVRFAESYRHVPMDAVISRGGTAQALRQVLHIPVIEVEFSVFDILRALQSAYLISKRYAVVGFPSITEPCKYYRDILKYNFEIFEVHSEEDVDVCMEHIKRKHIDLILGDVISYHRARSHGINALLVTSSAESIRRAFQNAIDICNMIQKSEQDAYVLRGVLDNNPHGVVVFRNDGTLLYMNHSCPELESNALQAMLQGYMDSLRTRQHFTFIKRHQGYLLNICAQRLQKSEQSYYVFYLSYFYRPSVTNSFLRIENFDEIEQQGNFIFTNAEYFQPLQPQLDQLSESSLPLLIYGAEGSGKTSIARYIHLHSANMHGPFITIHCDSLTETLWASLVEKANSPLYNQSCTIYFKNIHTLSLPLQDAMSVFFRDSALDRRNRILSSSCYHLPDMVAEGKFLHSLYLRLFDASIYVPTLNERRKDIPALANLCINYYNHQYNKEVIGLDENALDFLISNSWSLNFEHFQKIIKQLVATTPNFYITADKVLAALRPLTLSSQPAISETLDLSGSLEEIERAILLRVLADENMNQSAAAKRLGISRSTMWRKLTQASHS